MIAAAPTHTSILCEHKETVLNSSQSSTVQAADPVQSMDFHPVAELFPMMSPDEFEVFCLDIATNGLREEIWTHEGRIIDGRNRYKACLSVHVEPRFRVWNGVGNLTNFVVSLNLKRRHLSESQRAMVAQRLANLERGANQTDTQICGTVSQSDAAQMLNVSPRLVSDARKVAREADPEVTAMVESGEMQVSEAAEIVRLIPKEKQKKIIRKGRNARREILNSYKNKSLKQSSRSKAGCLLCSPDPEFTNATVSAAMQVLSDKAPTFARYFNDVVEEIESEGLSDETRSNYDKVFAAIDAGMCEHTDCRRVTGLDTQAFDLTIAAMLDYGMMEIYYQGGKTDHARGARKKMYRRTEKSLDADDAWFEEIDDDEEL